MCDTYLKQASVSVYRSNPWWRIFCIILSGIWLNCIGLELLLRNWELFVGLKWHFFSI